MRSRKPEWAALPSESYSAWAVAQLSPSTHRARGGRHWHSRRNWLMRRTQSSARSPVDGGAAGLHPAMGASRAPPAQWSGVPASSRPTSGGPASLPASTVPASNGPPESTTAASTLLASTPPASTPPASTAAASTPPASTAAASTRSASWASTSRPTAPSPTVCVYRRPSQPAKRTRRESALIRRG